jgi:hypothetical protein
MAIKPSKEYYTSEEVFAHIDEMLNRKISLFERFVWWPIVRFFRFFKESPDNIKWALQRVKNGYSDLDVWSLCHATSNIVINGCKYLRDHGHGYPSTVLAKYQPCKTFYKRDKKAEKEAIAEWNSILNKIIRAFELKNKQAEYLTLTKQELREVKEGFKLFEEYYNALWD